MSSIADVIRAAINLRWSLHTAEIEPARAALLRAVGELDLDHLKTVNDVMVRQAMWRLGVSDDPPARAELEALDLADMLSAQHCTNLGNPRGVLTTTLDDRAVAALYTVLHYDPAGGNDGLGKCTIDASSAAAAIPVPGRSDGAINALLILTLIDEVD